MKLITFEAATDAVIANAAIDVCTAALCGTALGRGGRVGACALGEYHHHQPPSLVQSSLVKSSLMQPSHGLGQHRSLHPLSSEGQRRQAHVLQLPGRRPMLPPHHDISAASPRTMVGTGA
jgi:hypothetical protein